MDTSDSSETDLASESADDSESQGGHGADREPQSDSARDPKTTARKTALLALHQGGALTTGQLRGLGTSATAQRTRVRRGELVRLRRGVLAPRVEGDRTRHPKLGAACLAVTGAVVSHESAARLHGLQLLRWTDPQVTVTVSKRPGSTPAVLDGLAVLVSALPDDQVTQLEGIPVTTLARTAIDLARTRELRDGLVALDSALRLGTTESELEDVLRGQRGWPGTRTARKALWLSDVRRESPLESFAAAVFAERGLPPSEPQAWIYDEYGFAGRVDEYWAEHQTVGEADGLVKYVEPQALRGEKVRQERLVNAGLEVVRYTSEDLWRRPVPTAFRVTQAFSRGPRLPRRFIASPTELSGSAWQRAWYVQFGCYPSG